jgi:starch phosphorylase
LITDWNVFCDSLLGLGKEELLGMSQWLNENVSLLKGKKILYMSMEMVFPEMNEEERFANFKGGLGVLACDTMEGLYHLGLDVIGVVPLYNFGWIETIKENQQSIMEKSMNYSKEPIETVKYFNGEPVVLNVDFEGQTYPVKVFRILRSGATVYLLKNAEVFDVLYTEDRKRRLRQEVVIGKSLPLLLNALQIDIDLLHLNEAHTVTAACYLKEQAKYQNIPILFTTHTPVPAGMEKYPTEWFNSLDLPEKYRDVFREDSVIDFTLAALKLSSLTNAVSQEHSEVTKNMFMSFREKIIGITNGSSQLWQAPELRNQDEVNPDRLWEIHLKYKRRALNDASRRLWEYLKMEVDFDLNKPCVCLIRRITWYKQQYPLLKDIVRALCAQRGETVDTPHGRLPGLGLQVFAGGVAHPNDKEMKEWVRHFIEWTKSDDLKGKFAFLPGYNHELLMHGARGYDIWISCPVEKLEACGTSDQRAALNGNLNISTFTGGARDYLKELNLHTHEGCALFIEPYSDRTLYRKLEIASKLVYDCIEGKNDTYKKIMFNSYQAGMTMSIENMVKSYALNFYLPALEKSLQAVRETQSNAPTH